MTWQLIHPELVIQGRERKRETEKERGNKKKVPVLFYDLVSESHCHFCLILFVKKRVTKSRPNSK